MKTSNETVLFKYIFIYITIFYNLLYTSYIQRISCPCFFKKSNCIKEYYKSDHVVLYYFTNNIKNKRQGYICTSVNRYFWLKPHIVAEFLVGVSFFAKKSVILSSLELQGVHHILCFFFKIL